MALMQIIAMFISVTEDAIIAAEEHPLRVYYS